VWISSLAVLFLPDKVVIFQLMTRSENRNIPTQKIIYLISTTNESTKQKKTKQNETFFNIF